VFFLAKENFFACSVCQSQFDNEKDAEKCCREKKIGMLCNACGKIHSSKKSAIKCCQSAKKDFREEEPE